ACSLRSRFFLTISATASSRTLRSSARQRDDGAQSRLIVLEPEFPAMQRCDRRSKAQSEARAWNGAALFQSHETLDHPLAHGFRDARPFVTNYQQSALAIIQCRHRNALRGAIFRRPGRGIFD